MTKLLQKAIEEVSKLSDEQQDAIATLITEEIEDEAKWDAAIGSVSKLICLEAVIIKP